MTTLLLNPPSPFEGKHVSREQSGIGLVQERFLPSELFLTAAYLRLFLKERRVTPEHAVQFARLVLGGNIFQGK